jgi:RNA polymerase sigma factor (sigma-70 family)
VAELSWLAHRFEENRTHLRSVAFRMLGSLDDAEDAVEESWIRLSRSRPDGVENLGGWLTAVVARVCLNKLRSLHARREESLEAHMSDLIGGIEDGLDPEYQSLLGDSVGLAMLVVLETLTPAERVALVLHDMFELPYDEIAPVVGRSPAATRQLEDARPRLRDTDGRFDHTGVYPNDQLRERS